MPINYIYPNLNYKYKYSNSHKNKSHLYCILDTTKSNWKIRWSLWRSLWLPLKQYWRLCLQRSVKMQFPILLHPDFRENIYLFPYVLLTLILFPVPFIQSFKDTFVKGNLWGVWTIELFSSFFEMSLRFGSKMVDTVVCFKMASDITFWLYHAYMFMACNCMGFG